jgi:hypothetical protein
VPAAAAAVALTGCGAGQAVSAIVDPVARAADDTARVSGYRINATVNVTSAAGTFTASIAGTLDTASHTGSLTTHEVVAGRTIALTEKITGTVVYISTAGEPAFAPLSGGKPWLMLNEAREVSAFGPLPGEGSDPSQFVDYLRAVGARPTRVGTATVGGVATTHYRAVIDLTRYPALVPAARHAAAARAVSAIERLLGAHTLPVDVWIGADRLVRRISIAIPECVDQQHLTMSMTMDLSDYGPQPPVQAPPAAQIRDVTQLVASSLKNAAPGCTASG